MSSPVPDPRLAAHRGQAMNNFMLRIQWAEGFVLPRNVGPFETRVEADRWGCLNVPNGSFEVWPLTPPYMPAKP